jgi:hypothetical protein
LRIEYFISSVQRATKKEGSRNQKGVTELSEGKAEEEALLKRIRFSNFVT